MLLDLDQFPLLLHLQKQVSPKMELLEDYLSFFPSGACKVDVMELFGGTAGTTRVLTRRGYVSGGNFDFVTDWNLLNPAHDTALMRTLRRLKPRVVIMAPPCKMLSSLVSCFGKFWRNLR